ncbi:MAG: hypothetical protein ACJ77D_09885 [Chloroflexota bacterium]
MIEQSLVIVTLTELPDTDPLTTVVPRTATEYRHGSTAFAGVIVTLTRALFVVVS